MTRTYRRVLAVGVVLAGAAGTASAAELYAPPSAGDVRSQMVEWIAAQADADPAAREEAVKSWADGDDRPTPTELLDRVVAGFAAVDADTRQYVEACRLESAPLLPPEPPTADAKDEFFAQNLALFHGRYLVQRRMYDEALATLEEVDPAKVVDPASALFLRAVCEHQLLEREEGLKTIAKLLGDTESVPTRYRTVATLMQYELQNFRPESLDEVARLMSDIERRLDLGRAGQRVQKKEDEAVALLDKIIEKLEQQGGGGGGGEGQGPPRGNQSSSPANESRIGGQTAPGNVDEKNPGPKEGWGSLPPKEAERAKNIIGRNFPPHYRQAIEKYFRELAKIKREADDR